MNSHLPREAMSWKCSPRNMGLLFTGSLLVYVAVMDCILFFSVQSAKSLPQVSKGDNYSKPFDRLSVQIIFQNHMVLYIMSPLAEYFDFFTGMSRHFPFITPNVISFVHVILCIPVVGFITSTSLRWRRIGLLLYVIGIWLDSLDGVIFRSQQKLYSIQEGRIWNKSVDHLCDEVAGSIFFVAVFLYLLGQRPLSLPTNLPSRFCLFWNQKKEGTKIYVAFIAVCFGAQLYLELCARVKVADKFADILQSSTSDIKIRAAQQRALHQYGTFFFMWIWKFSQEYIIALAVAIYIDKLWEFLLFVRYLGFAVLLIMYTGTIMYTDYLKKLVFTPDV